MIILRNKFFSRKNTRYKGRKPTPYNNVRMKPKTTVADILNRKSANTATASVTPKQLPIVAEPKQLPAIVEKPKVNPSISQSPTVTKQLPTIVPKNVPATMEKPKVNPLPIQSSTSVPKKVPTLVSNIVKKPGIGNSILGKVGKFARKNKVALTVGGLTAYGLGVNHLMNNNE